MEQIRSNEADRYTNDTTETVKPLRKSSLTPVRRLLSIEEKFLKICITHIEGPERGGSLPIEYSSLRTDDIKKAISDSEESSKEIQSKNQEQEKLQEISDMISSLKKEAKIVVVRNVEDVINPLGEISDVTLFFISDEHETPSDISAGTRSLAFKRYAPERIVGSVVETIKNLKTPQNKYQPDFQTPEYNSDEKIPSSSVTYKHIVRTEARFLFNSWLSKYLVKKSQQDKESNDSSTSIIVRTGDQVTDGATFIDQLGVEGDYLRMLTELTDKHEIDAKMFSVYGNHDQDSRIPESISMLSELLGQKIFYQEIGDALVIAVDTNIENPVWVSDFLKRADENGKTMLELKRKYQDIVLKRMIDFPGEIVVIGHHPSRIINSFGVENDIFQRSNVVCVVGGHTHHEDHIETPLKNKNGNPITLHFLDSTLKADKNGNPLPSKSYSVRVKDGHIGVLNTLQETQESFTARYNNLQLEKDLI
jgi:hypothetical protein